MSALRRMARWCAGGGLALALWQGLVWITGLPPFLLPGPVRVGEALWSSRAELAAAAATTATEVGLGFVLGAGCGAALAVVMALSARLRDLVRPVLLFSQTIPIFALAPILTLWLGYGMAPKVAVTMLIVFFPVATAFLDGLARTPPAWLDLARTMGARPWREMTQVRIPAALPALGTGLRLAAVYAPVGAVIGEWVGGSQGLGAVMIHANGRMKVDLVFAALIVLAVMTVLFFRLTDYAVGRWLQRQDAILPQAQIPPPAPAKQISAHPAAQDRDCTRAVGREEPYRRHPSDRQSARDALDVSDPGA